MVSLACADALRAPGARRCNLNALSDRLNGRSKGWIRATRLHGYEASCGLMERDWVHLGAVLRAGREALGLTQAEMGERIGIGRDAVRDIEQGERKRLTASVKAYAQQLGWVDGSIEDVLAGREPTILESVSDSSPLGADNPNVENRAHYAQGMPARVTVSISAGQVYDTDIIDLSTSANAPLVMIAKDLPADASEADRAAYVRVWTRIQREAHRIANEELSNPQVDT